MTKKKVIKKSPKEMINEIKDRKIDLSSDKIQYAFIATILSIIGFIIAILVKRNDKYVMNLNVFNKII